VNDEDAALGPGADDAATEETQTFKTRFGTDHDKRKAELHAMPGFRLKNDIDSLRRAGHVMSKNAEELNTHAAKFLQRRTMARDITDEYTDELVRYLHNYLTSVTSLGLTLGGGHLIAGLLVLRGGCSRVGKTSTQDLYPGVPRASGASGRGHRTPDRACRRGDRRWRTAGISPRQFTPVTTVVDLDAHRPKDLVDRRFDLGRLDKVWTSDITYLNTDQGWLYLRAVRDGCSRRVLGWAVEDHMRTDLVESALSMAVTMRGHLPGQVIFHADRGTQYTSGQLARFARRHGIAQSVGRTGVCWDNAQAESFWSTMKSEFYHRYYWPTKDAARLAVGDWIERVYNRRRRHSKLGMISPVEFEHRHTQTAQAA
jgi:putative transposase